MDMSIQAKFAEYNLKSSISTKEAMRSYLELLFSKKEEMPHQSLVFLHEEVDRLTCEIEALNRQLGNARKPSISVYA